MIDLELDSAFTGLKGEVVDRDIYLMRDVANVVSCNDPNYVHERGHTRAFRFTPTIIFDFGANIGLFSKYCRDLFPDAIIVSVEPHPANFERLLLTIDNDPKCKPINSPIGKGKIFRSGSAANGSGECYLSVGSMGYENPVADTVDMKPVTVAQVMDAFLTGDPLEKIVVKMDIEGAENSVFDDVDSMDRLRKADYLVVELHWYAQTHEGVLRVKEKTLAALETFKETHNTRLDNCYFYAVKK